MSIQKLIQNLTLYNYNANEKMVLWLQNKDINLLYKPVQSSFKSLDETIQHILKVQQFWTEFICGRDISGFDWSFKENQAELHLSELLSQSKSLQEAFILFSEKDLSEILLLNTSWSKSEQPRYDFIVHVLNHSTYHRGQLVSIARSLGITDGVPSTDYRTLI